MAAREGRMGRVAWVSARVSSKGGRHGRCGLGLSASNRGRREERRIRMIDWSRSRLTRCHSSSRRDAHSGRSRSCATPRARPSCMLARGAGYTVRAVLVVAMEREDASPGAEAGQTAREHVIIAAEEVGHSHTQHTEAVGWEPPRASDEAALCDAWLERVEQGPSIYRCRWYARGT